MSPLNPPQLPLFSIPGISDSYSADSQIVLYPGDTYDFLRSVPAGVARLIITSPPYNLGKEYEVRVSLRQYLKTQEKVIDELVRVLNDAGSICWQVGNFVQEGEVYPLDVYYYDIFKDRGLRLRNRI